MGIIELFSNTWWGGLDYLWKELHFATSAPWWHNYFWWLIALSAFFFALEIAKPWRSKQGAFRKDFWLDLGYMFFNYSLFGVIIFGAASSAFAAPLANFMDSVGITNAVSASVAAQPIWVHLLIGFVVRDFVQWWIHRLLHRSNFLWRFHKVHHSVEEMGFAAHLRYHWMENVVYRTIEYIPLAFIGISIGDFFIIHIFTLAVGHYNHSNLVIPTWLKGTMFGISIGLFLGFVVFDTEPLFALGVVACGGGFGAIALSPIMKFLFNGPEMHIWHHARELPHERRFGINFGLTLACWDYLFGTAYMPHDGRDIQLGFPGREQYPNGFIRQQISGWFGREKNVRVDDKKNKLS
jgi:sterol desaturase/sphingolipid hydroxylase (fatty acid hydroxylase superfamily)